MKIGFDAKRAFRNHTGLGNYSRTLIKNLQSIFPGDHHVYFTPDSQSPYSGLFHSGEIITPSGLAPLWRSFGVKKDIKKAGLDLFHGLSNELPVGIHHTGVPSIVTIHDVIFDIVPEDFPWFDRNVYRLKTLKCIQQATKIIAISNATKVDLVNRFDAPPEKITVIYQPIDRQFYKNEAPGNKLDEIRKRYDLPDSFLLFVGAFMKRKNVLAMIKAWELLPDDQKIPFLVFGDGRRYKNEIIQYIRGKRLERMIRIHPPVPFQHLPILYHLAESVIYPSKYEGFGLPILEALACGARVVTSSVNSMPEAGGELPVYVNPHSIDSISEGISKSLEQSRPDPVLLTQHLARFEPAMLTEQVRELYRDVCKK